MDWIGYVVVSAVLIVVVLVVALAVASFALRRHQERLDDLPSLYEQMQNVAKAEVIKPEKPERAPLRDVSLGKDAMTPEERRRWMN